MIRKMFHGVSSSKSSPRLAIREPALEPPRDALLQQCKWLSDSFMFRDDIKEEFDMYVHNAELMDLLSDKCSQYHDLTISSMWKFKYVSHHTSHDVMFNLSKNPFRMTIEEFSEACRVPYWGHALNLANLIAMNFL